MGLLERIAAARGGDETRFAIDPWIADYLLPANVFSFSGVNYPFGLNQTLANNRSREISNTLPGYMAALRLCPPAFAAQMVRALVLSQARFVFRNNRISRTPGRTFGTSALAPLEQPWTNGTTGELLSRMEWHAGPAGNSYVTNRTPGRLRVLRPDWVVIVYGSHQQPEDAAHALDGEVIGYIYTNGGTSGPYKPETLLPGEVAHWSPLPDPENAGIGMSWITPAVREIQGDQAATDHKLRFFQNGATPNMVVKGLRAATKEQFDEYVDMMETRHAGVRNAYRTLYLQEGADATVVGSDLRQIDFKATQGAGETRISMLSRVHPVILGASEGLQGSSLNAGNFGAARRMWADSWIYPTLQDMAAALAPLIRVPPDAELWTDTAGMPILREDASDAANIEQTKASTMVSLINGGFTPESVVPAVESGDLSTLVHSGLISVQLQPPGAAPPGTSPAVGGGVGPKVPAARSADDDEPDEETLALIVALDELLGDDEERAWDPAKHPRNPAGSPGGGRFRSIVDRIKDAIEEHYASGGKGDPLAGFNREQLRRAAKAHGIELSHGESIDSIKAKILDKVAVGKPGKSKAAKVAKKAAPKLVGEDAIRAGDFSGLKRIGAQKGANPGGLFQAPDGSKWYVKAQKGLDQANNEALAADLYRAVGIETPKVHVGSGTPGMPGEHHTATRYVPGISVDLKDRVNNDPTYLSEIWKGFAADSWLANWDVAGENPAGGWDNIVSDASGHPLRIDVGGSLLFKGLGGPKGSAFGPVVTEWDKFREDKPSRASSVVFHHITSEDMISSANLIENISDQRIRELVAEHHLPSSLAETLIQRREDIRSRVDELQTVDPFTSTDFTKGAATQWGDVKAAAPVLSNNIKGYLLSYGHSDLDAVQSHGAVQYYTSSGYTPINRTLLQGKYIKGGGGYEDQNIDAIDRVMAAHSELTRDVVVFRGERNPSRSFPKGTWSPTGGMEGMEWTFPAFGSSSTDYTIAENFATSTGTSMSQTKLPTVMRIRVPKGTRAVAIGGGFASEGEQELILDRGLRYRVVADHGVIDGVRKLDVEVVPHVKPKRKPVKKAAKQAVAVG